MGNLSDETVTGMHSQVISRGTFLEVTAGLFAAYSARSLKAQPWDRRIASEDATPRRIETPPRVLRLDPNTGNLIGITWKKQGGDHS
jgi:hypothetical protein